MNKRRAAIFTACRLARSHFVNSSTNGPCSSKFNESGIVSSRQPVPSTWCKVGSDPGAVQGDDRATKLSAVPANFRLHEARHHARRDGTGSCATAVARGIARSPWRRHALRELGGVAHAVAQSADLIAFRDAHATTSAIAQVPPTSRHGAAARRASAVVEMPRQPVSPRPPSGQISSASGGSRVISTDLMRRPTTLSAFKRRFCVAQRLALASGSRRRGRAADRRPCPTRPAAARRRAPR